MTFKIDTTRHQKAFTSANSFLDSNERKRRQLRLQRGIAELLNDRFDILLNNEFVEGLIEYLQVEYHSKSTAPILKLLDKIGEVACSSKRELRERAVFILSVIADKSLESDNYIELLEVISFRLVHWLQNETEFLAGFQFICQQLQTMLRRMLHLGVWYQSENMVIILSQIQKGIIQKPDIMRKVICQVHADLADETFLRKLVDIVLDIKEDRRDIARCLLLHLGSKAAAVMVQTLIDCQDKDKRFGLLEFIPATGKDVVPICEYCLKQDPPWYVIRNLTIIISRLADPNLYSLVRPHLAHKDIRVQMQILNCITKLGGANVRDRLIESLKYVSDDLKQQVVVQLGNMGGREVGNALCELLEKREQFAVHVRDELLWTICNKIKFLPMPRTRKVIKEFVSQRKQQVDESEKVLLAAKDALKSLELKMSAETLPAKTSTAPMATDPFIVPVATEEEFDQLLRENKAAGKPRSTSPGGILKVNPADSATVETNTTAKIVVVVPDSEEMKRHNEVWSRFYAKMSEEEARIFRAALKFRTYKPGEMVVARGNSEPSLHLFDTGTVRLGRIKPGEEAYFKDMGAGDLIGSDVFLSGEPWNLSLYAGTNLSAHVFNLDNMLKTHVELPHLADKILSYCTANDILPSMLRVLDNPRRWISEKTQFVRPHGPAVQAIIVQKLQGGLSYLFPVKQTDKINKLLHSPLNIDLRLPSGAVHAAAARAIGIVQTKANHLETIVFTQFKKPQPDPFYTCENIELTDPA